MSRMTDRVTTAIKIACRIYTLSGGKKSGYQTPVSHRELRQAILMKVSVMGRCFLFISD